MHDNAAGTGRRPGTVADRPHETHQTQAEGEATPGLAWFELELRHEIVHRVEALRRLRTQATFEGTADLGRDRGDAGKRPHVPLGDVEDEGHEAVVVERVFPVERLIEGDAEGELIATRVGPHTVVLLRSHVGRRAEHRARLRQRLAELGRAALGDGRHARRRAGFGIVGAGRAGETKIGDTDGAVVSDQDVGRLEVAMHEPGRVRSGQPLAGGAVHREDLRPVGAARLALGLDPTRQIHAVDELHRDEDPRDLADLDRADIEHLQQVRVGDLGHRSGLAYEAAAALRCSGRSNLRPQELDRHLAVELRIVRGEDDAHPALAQRVDDDVAADDVASLRTDRVTGARCGRRRVRTARCRAERRFLRSHRVQRTSAGLFPRARTKCAAVCRDVGT